MICSNNTIQKQGEEDLLIISHDIQSTQQHYDNLQQQQQQFYQKLI